MADVLAYQIRQQGGEDFFVVYLSFTLRISLSLIFARFFFARVVLGIVSLSHALTLFLSHPSSSILAW